MVRMRTVASTAKGTVETISFDCASWDGGRCSRSVFVWMISMAKDIQFCGAMRSCGPHPLDFH